MGMPRSTFYYKKRANSREKELLDIDVRDEIERVHAEFPGYGWRRIKEHFSRLGIRINHKRIKRIQRENGLYPIIFRTFKVNTTNSNHSHRIYPNLKAGKLIQGLDKVWVADLTYIRLNLEFIYLAVVLDNYSRKAIGWAVSKSLEHTVCLEALREAIRNRKPKPGVIHHSDRGVQYACDNYIGLLQQYGFQVSMSAKGNCYDNAHMESFFKTLKYEEIHLHNYETMEDVVRRLPKFIEEVYNKKRFHSSLDNRTPEEFETWVKKQTRANRPSLQL